MGWGAKEQAANRGRREPCLAGTMPRRGPHGRVKYNSIVVGQSSPRNLREIDVFLCSLPLNHMVFPQSSPMNPIVFPSFLARPEHRYFHCRHACSVFSTFRSSLWIMCLGYSRKRPRFLSLSVAIRLGKPLLRPSTSRSALARVHVIEVFQYFLKKMHPP